MSRLGVWFAEPTASALEEVLAEDVHFHSPAADYVGSVDVGHILAAIATVLQGLRVTHAVADHPRAISFVSARVAGEEIDGVIVECVDAGGRVVEVTLLLRPFAVLRTAMARTAEHLEQHPLPRGHQ